MKKEEEKQQAMMPCSVDFRLEGGVLEVEGLLNKIRLETFLKQLKEGTRITVTYEVITPDASYSQLAKVHACIREIAKETGHTPQEIKELVKDKAHLYSEPGKLKSFADCNKSELSLGIQACIELGDSLGCNLNQL